MEPPRASSAPTTRATQRPSADLGPGVCRCARDRTPQQSGRAASACSPLAVSRRSGRQPRALHFPDIVKGRSARSPRPPNNGTASPGRRAAVSGPAPSGRRSSAGSRRRLFLRSRRAAHTAGSARGDLGRRRPRRRGPAGGGKGNDGVGREASRGHGYLRACPDSGRQGHGPAGAHDVRSAPAWAAGSGRRPRPRAHAAILRRAALSKWPPGRAAVPTRWERSRRAPAGLPLAPRRARGRGRRVAQPGDRARGPEPFEDLSPGSGEAAARLRVRGRPTGSARESRKPPRSPKPPEPPFTWRLLCATRRAVAPARPHRIAARNEPVSVWFAPFH